jgi:hypothetical protein
MKRAKIVLITTAIVAAVCCAFVTKTDPVCVDCTQYYLTDINVYRYAGIWGNDFDCDYDPGGACTYYKPDPAGHPDVYVMCHDGDIIFIPQFRKEK